MRKARKLHAELGFDLVHHVTFANMWLPALVGFVEAPFVLGPVGGGPRVPFRLYPELGAGGAAREIMRSGLQTACRLNPLTRASWSRAETIVVQNCETRAALPRRHRSRVVVRSNASVPTSSIPIVRANGTIPTASANGTRQMKTALFAGRLVPWKGGTLALRAIERTSDWSLTVIGGGPDHARLTTLAEQLGLHDRVTFIPWLAQPDLWDAMAHADALLLPSLRDDAGFVVAEAQALGLPVVAFDQGGPHEFAGLSGSTVLIVPLTGSDAVGALAEGLRRVPSAPRTRSATAYAIPTIARFLATTYEAATGAAKPC